MATAIDTETGIMSIMREGYIHREPESSYLNAKDAGDTLSAGMQG